jgi:hypothetical protein
VVLVPGVHLVLHHVAVVAVVAELSAMRKYLPHH